MLDHREQIQAKELVVNDKIDGAQIIDSFTTKQDDHYDLWEYSLNLGPIVVKEVSHSNRTQVIVHFDISFEPILLDGDKLLTRLS